MTNAYQSITFLIILWPLASSLCPIAFPRPRKKTGLRKNILHHLIEIRPCHLRNQLHYIIVDALEVAQLYVALEVVDEFVHAIRIEIGIALDAQLVKLGAAKVFIGSEKLFVDFLAGTHAGDWELLKC